MYIAKVYIAIVNYNKECFGLIVRFSRALSMNGTVNISDYCFRMHLISFKMQNNIFSSFHHLIKNIMYRVIIIYFSRD